MPYSDATTPTDRYLSREIVVESRDEGLLLAELKGFVAGEPEGDHVLGLTRIRLDSLDRFPFDPELDARMRDEAGTTARGADPSDLDRVLYHLRDRFQRTTQWVPRMAKIRMYAEGTPYTGGGTGDPQELAAGTEVVIEPRESYQGPRVRIGILDGALYRHPGLAGHYLADSSVFGATDHTDPPATLGHAVHLAGIVARQAPGADLVIRQALDASNEVDSWTLAKAMVRFSGEVDLLLTSLGGATWDDKRPFVLERAESRLDCVHVASAGNWGKVVRPGPYPSPTRDSAIFPAALPGVIAVGALDDEGGRADYSQSGPWMSLMAPGAHDGLFLERAALLARNSHGALVANTDRKPVNFGGVARWPGTSASAAYVAGALAAVAMAQGTSLQEAAETVLSGHPGLAQEIPQVRGIRPYSPDRDRY
ncbi:S8/S53 family peptidase [Nonomuraea sp. NPDC048916]|uniref:S8 family peptidase n=1 Tax=Nonomuraea sp. NPDC048916 TaxID=3154232 RepID=UPI0033FC74A8